MRVVALLCSIASLAPIGGALPFHPLGSGAIQASSRLPTPHEIASGSFVPISRTAEGITGALEASPDGLVFALGRYATRSVARVPATEVGPALGAQAPNVHPISGRPIAHVMGHEGAAWLDRPERDREEEPDRALDAIGIAKGSIVSDVGAGSGYFTVRLAHRVGSTGKVYATDIQREMLALLAKRLDRERLRNVELVLGSEADPKLPAGGLDLILMVDVYHELAQPQEMLQRLRAALKPTGRLVLLEYRKEDPSVPIRFEHKMSVAEAKLELEAEGFTLDKVLDVLPRQHILIFTPANR